MDDPLKRLTKRQMDGAEQVASGLTNREVATRLGIGKPAVDGHMKIIFSSLKISNRSSLALLVQKSNPPQSRRVSFGSPSGRGCG